MMTDKYPQPSDPLTFRVIYIRSGGLHHHVCQSIKLQTFRIRSPASVLALPELQMPKCSLFMCPFYCILPPYCPSFDLGLHPSLPSSFKWHLPTSTRTSPSTFEPQSTLLAIILSIKNDVQRPVLTCTPQGQPSLHGYPYLLPTRRSRPRFSSRRSQRITPKWCVQYLTQASKHPHTRSSFSLPLPPLLPILHTLAQ